MNLRLNGDLGRLYPGPTQWARNVTEGWAHENLYCIACNSRRLTAYGANQAVEDFHCPSCSRRIQLKAKNGNIGRVVRNSAYAKKAEAILANRAPDYCFMAYDKQELLVRDVLWVPGHFITLSVVSKCPPLRPEARRAGWVGSNIHLDRVPDHGKIPLVSDGRVRRMKDVRDQFQSMAFLQQIEAEGRGWISDVLACIDDVARPGATFANRDIYAFQDRLERLHPGNHHVLEKVRQQLQVLERRGVIARLSPGVYQRL